MLPTASLAKSVLEKSNSDFHGVIRELGAKKPLGVGRKLLLLWEKNCRFLATDYTICLGKKEKCRAGRKNFRISRSR